MKKLLIALSSISFISLFGLSIYVAFLPQEVSSSTPEIMAISVDETTVEAKSTPDTISGEVLVQQDIESKVIPGVNYLLFVSNDADSVFLQNNVLKPLAQSLNIESFSNLVTIDMSVLPTDYSPVIMKQKWGVENFPAFAVLTVNEDGSYTYSDTLEWTNSEPLNEAEVKAWMIQVGEWLGPKEDVGEKIVEPIN